MSVVRRNLMNGKGSKEPPNYLCFTAIEDGTFTLTLGNLCGTNCISYIEYSTDGYIWIKTSNVNNTEVVVTTPTILAGNKVYWRGSGTRNGIVAGNNLNYFGIFSSTGKFDVSGNIGSYLYGQNYDSVTYENRSFISLFRNCVNIVNAKDLILPSNFANNADYVYDSLFRDCTALISAPSLTHITGLKPYIYQCMFYGCTSLTTAPELPATILASDCYHSMFDGCSALTQAPELPANSLVKACYNLMFRKCTSLVTAPTLRITSIEQASCANMFDSCRNLENISITVTATTVYKQSFAGMFWYCDKLTFNNLSLPTLTLAESCYDGMLYLTKINYIKMLATDISATNCLRNWMYGVPNVSTSIFVKHIDAQWTTTGNNGVPTGWTIIYYDPSEDKYYTDQTKTTECDDHGNTKAIEATTNPEVMAVVYNKGWSASPDFMTFNEASAVTDIEQAFRNAGITHFEELRNFSSVTTLKTNAFLQNNIVRLALPKNLTIIQNQSVYNQPLEYLRFPSSTIEFQGNNDTNFGNNSNSNFELHIDDWEAYCKSTGNSCAGLFSGNQNTFKIYVEKNELPKTVIIPNGVTSLRRNFLAKYNNGETLIIPDTVTTIEYNAFGYSYLGWTNKIDIGSGVTSIATYAFTNIRSCPTLICRAMTAPTLGTNVFQWWGYNVPNGTPKKLVVPRGSTGYDADQWKTVLQDARGYVLTYLDEYE